MLAMFLNFSVTLGIKGIKNYPLFPSSFMLSKFCSFVLLLNKVFNIMKIVCVKNKIEKITIT